jgi:uncharacterized caspase-like protein
MNKAPLALRTLILTTAFTFLLNSSVIAQQGRDLQLSQTANQTSGKRTALVIGNGAYTSSPLKNPPNDATDMAKALSSVGFTVEHGVNLTQRQMKAMIREFGQKLKAGGQGLFYFAGHGIQLRGRNYLIPVDAEITSEADVEDQGVDANLIMGLMDEAGNGLNVVILDACRNNPFARSYRSATNGLVQMDAPRGTLIAYATAPGSVASDGNARNGLYTQELLKFIKVPDLSIEEVFKQVRISVGNLTQNKPNKQTPWEASSLVGDFYFIRTKGTAAKVSQPSPAVDSTSTGTTESSAAALTRKAKELFDKNEYNEAITVATEAIKLDPQYAEAYRQRGWAYMLKRDMDTAIMDFTEAIQLNPQDSAAYKDRAYVFNEKGDRDRAIRDYTEAIRINPQDAKAYTGRGNIYGKNKDYIQAVRDFTEAVALDPKNGISYFSRAFIYKDKKDYDQAIADFTAAIRLFTEAWRKSTAYRNRADVYKEKKDYDQALNDYTEAIRLDPNDTNYSSRAELYEILGDSKKAAEDERKASEP